MSRFQYHYPHFTDGETEAQRGDVTCQRTHSWSVAEIISPLHTDCLATWMFPLQPSKEQGLIDTKPRTLVTFLPAPIDFKEID
uniref:Uncharacterized protein n=1 Tax=Gopherus agassizii TaxID=38772 RepID=A0A452HYH4_9SAUR